MGISSALGLIVPTVDGYGNRNRLINGDFAIAQRGTSFTSTGSANNDNTYNLDRWVLLSDGNNTVNVTQSTDVPTGGLFSAAMTVVTTNRKFGLLQVIEQANITGFQNQTVSLSFKARTSGSSLSNIKAVVLAWTGTADSVTRDVVSTWNGDGVTPTWATNWVAENTPTNLAVTNSWADYQVTALMDASNIRNVAVFIWNDDTSTTANDVLYLDDVQLELGNTATPFERRPIGTELALCQRYYWRVTRHGSDYERIPSVGPSYSGSSAQMTVTNPVRMRIPAQSVDWSGIGVTDQVSFDSAAATTVNVATTSSLYSSNVTMSGMTGVNDGSGRTIILRNSGSFLGFSAEL